MSTILDVQDLNVYYGVIHALKGISFHVDKGEIVTLIGANGAGKTTTLQTITGLIPARSGHVFYNGKEITHTPGVKMVGAGLAHVPEGRRVFAQLSVYQNLMLGAYTRKDKDGIAESLETVYKHFPRLEERKNQVAGTLSGGEQQMLAMGRALMSNPEMIVMDEPSTALDPVNRRTVISTINSRKETKLIASHDLDMILDTCQRVILLNHGRIVADGEAETILRDQALLEANRMELPFCLQGWMGR